MGNPSKRDFFVSYTGPDVVWAEWIAWHLEQDQYTTTIQAWDFRPGHNFAVAMQDASETAERTIAVISPAFFASPYTNAEWASAFTEDPDGRQAKFVPVRVRDCEPPGLHKGIIYIDLVGLDEAAAHTELLDGVRPGRGKPTRPPIFPGGAAAAAQATPDYPGDAPPIWNVPIAARTFEGRAGVLAKLAGELATDGRATITQSHAIHGLGGVGKTQLVSRFAHEHRDEYDVVWWIRAEQEATRLEDYASLATKLELPATADAGQSELVSATKSWLERSGRWLLIFDNARDPGAIAPLLPDGHAGHVLITSRRHANWRSLGASPLQLNVWERHESVDFLTRTTDSEDRTAADRIARLLGDLPLALSQAAAYTNEQAITLETFHSRLVTRGESLLGKGKPLDYGATVTTTWDLAFDQVGTDQPVSELLNVCAYLAPERIPRELLAAVRPEASSESVDDMVQSLLNYALLTAAGEETLDMHRLVQQVARERLTPEAQAAAASAGIALMQKAMPIEVQDPRNWPQCARILPHALTVTEHAQALEDFSVEVLNLQVRCAMFLHARADYKQAKDLLLRSVQLAERAYGPSHPIATPALGNLGNILLELGDLAAAREAQERVLEIEEATFGPNHPEVAKTLSNLGIVLHELGEPAAAREAVERALGIEEAAYGPQDPEVAQTLSNLGMVLHELGELPAAREAQERALGIEEAAYGPDHPEVAKTLGNLGSALHELGELPAAREAQERALEINERTYGPDHPEVAKTLGNLGIVLRRLGETAAAREAQERALEIEEAAFGPDHPEVAKTLGNLAIVQVELGERSAARDATERALAIFTASYGAPHALTRKAARHLESLSDPPG
jgi:tetratricopeptide (TPR) repeat protein